MRAAPWLAHYDPDVPPTLEPYPERTLLDDLSESARSIRTSLRALQGTPVSYAELDRLSNALAAALRARGGLAIAWRCAAQLPAVPDRRVWRVEGRCHPGPLNPIYTERELQEALSASGAETIVVLNRLRPDQGHSTTDVAQASHRHGIKEYLPSALRGYTLLKEEEGEHG